MKLTPEQRRVRETHIRVIARPYYYEVIVARYNVKNISTLEEAEHIADELAIALTNIIAAERKPAIVKPEPRCGSCWKIETRKYQQKIGQHKPKICGNCKEWK